VNEVLYTGTFYTKEDDVANFFAKTADVEALRPAGASGKDPTVSAPQCCASWAGSPGPR
jgi:hypothetical protein